jgi:hypothetical protein
MKAAPRGHSSIYKLFLRCAVQVGVSIDNGEIFFVAALLQQECLRSDRVCSCSSANIGCHSWVRLALALVRFPTQSQPLFGLNGQQCRFRGAVIKEKFEGDYGRYFSRCRSTHRSNEQHNSSFTSMPSRCAGVCCSDERPDLFIIFEVV